MRPRIALRAVVLPAPLGPMSPTIRPSSTRRSTPASAMVFPNALRRPRASMHAMRSALLLFRFRLETASGTAVQKFFGGKAEQANGFVDPRPFFLQKPLPFAAQQKGAGAGIDKHAAPTPG